MNINKNSNVYLLSLSHNERGTLVVCVSIHVEDKDKPRLMYVKELNQLIKKVFETDVCPVNYIAEICYY